ncbi:MAG: hypothetical protein KC455_11200 [Carnobacterium sp.]|nr:hypothetical protein [Carnobacterium sp.]
MNTTNNINTDQENFDKYMIKQGSIDSTNEYSIIVNFKTETISGACFRNGFLDHMIDIKKCIELLEDIKKYYIPKRDFSSILEKYML